MIKQGQTFIDTLLQLMPDLGKSNLVKSSRDYVNSAAAESLFSVWKNSSNRKRDFIRPTTMSIAEVNNMKDEGLIQSLGNKIEVTSKGEKVIKIMILGDSKSSFEDDGIVIDYNQALANTKDVKTAKKHRAASSWWDRF